MGDAHLEITLTRVWEVSQSLAGSPETGKGKAPIPFHRRGQGTRKPKARGKGTLTERAGVGLLTGRGR